MAISKATKPVVVTTAHRGVFFGYVTESQSLDVKTIRLERARCCVYWPVEVKGFMGLAAGGPTSGSRIGPAVPALNLQDVTSVIEASAKAAKAWETVIWQ